ncbi:UDP-N-acetylglucosamine--undecaprenyl-phosphate N-acetylglucosaminephosphotransferase [Photobacterium alginatilyticum]|uniref:Undecaprenyl-phosphate alpha-N-acetylglucosaminyl 1-phosphate transferase n=1 Tax=Photobacterium alginatilyticum TaxID=1775171 RepID=A0ABW9YD46_9GAMM|nr:UDP-N-acetylglucosamine--undecaprenyl-phosphate N-acetylglucosaminephosphotransferase [Photobacterium alginatilyticum]NBI51581.1 undecaprenyl-phosphate alpha-N-acetylglucosaminyl 1-phosphate transferase [Photobacterium alginatilyticum]
MDSGLALIFIFSFASLFVLRKVAKKIQLVDVPSGRKQHLGSIPLIGGLAIFGTVTLALFMTPDLARDTNLYLFCASVLVFTGAIDDKYDISFKARLVIQVMMSIIMIKFGSLYLASLGNLLGFGNLTLNTPLSYLVTTLAVLGAINAFNMVDGIDGLLGGLATVTFSSLGYLFWLDHQLDLYHFCLVIVIATIPYVMLNLGFPLGQRFKVFMGDAGSVFIGFTVIWLLVNGTQGESTPLRPVTALWLIALPLMDMTTIMIRRIRKGQSPFKPDREHLHHICQRIGLSQRMTLLAICGLASLFAYIGVLGEQAKVSESIMFSAFLTLFVTYYLSITHIWRITAFLRKININMTEIFSKRANRENRS